MSLVEYIDIFKEYLLSYKEKIESYSFNEKLNFCFLFSIYYLYFTGLVLSYYLFEVLKSIYLPFLVVFLSFKKRITWKKRIG